MLCSPAKGKRASICLLECSGDADDDVITEVRRRLGLLPERVRKLPRDVVPGGWLQELAILAGSHTKADRSAFRMFEEMTMRDAEARLRWKPDSGLDSGQTELPDGFAGSPDEIRHELTRVLRREMSHALAKRPNGIRMCVCALTDPVLIDMLYDASCAGVNIRLYVTGACRLQPGVEHLSKTIRVRTVFDHMLPEGCVLETVNGGQTEICLSDCNWSEYELNKPDGHLWIPQHDEAERAGILLDMLDETIDYYELVGDAYTAPRCRQGKE